MHLGIGTYAYAWAIGVPGYAPASPMSATGILERAAHLGVRVVQFADNLPLHQLSADELVNLLVAANRLGIDLEVGTRGVARDHLLTYLRLAERIGSPIVRVVVDTAEHHPSADEIVASLTGLMPDFARAGVRLAIENHDRFKARVLARIVERIASDHVGICLDTVNSFGALEGPDVVAAALGPQTINLHVKDFAISRVSHMMGFVVEGRPAGQGQLDVPWLLEQLAGYGRDCNAILELWPPPEATLDATIAKEDAWAALSIAYLRQLIPT